MLRCLVVLATFGCSSAVELTITSDRGSGALSSMCVGVADTSATGGHFGKNYSLAEIGGLPQTLRVEPGGASSAWAWVRGDRAGVPVAWADAEIDFAQGVTLAMPACQSGRAGEPAQVGDPVGPGSARLVASQGQGGWRVVALGGPDAPSQVIAVDHGTLVATAAPALAAPVLDAVAFDADGDCDDDVVIALAGAPPELWLRDGDQLVDGGPIGSAAVDALAAGDVDGDGDIDLVVGAGDTLTVLANDGGGGFSAVPGAIAAGSDVAAISALALGDIDGDGNPDLVVGQAGSGILAAWAGQVGGSFLPAPGFVPPVPLDVARLTLVDATGDFAPDLEVAVAGAPWRLYIDRDGVLEDQSFVRLPQPVPVAGALAVGGWDSGCLPDVVVATGSGGPALHGQADGTFSNDGEIPPATDVVLVDIEDDDVLDAVLATDQGVVWVAR